MLRTRDLGPGRGPGSGKLLRRSLAALAWSVITLACGPSGMPAASHTSPSSPHAEPAPERAIAMSLREDPLAAPAAEGGAVDAGAYYTCPMHPEVQSAKPGTCPKCGMRLVPSSSHEHGHEHAH